MPREEIIRLLPEYDVLLTIFHSHSPVDREIIDAGKRLRLISNYGVGYNNIDTAYAREKGIAVTNTPRSVCNPTAELAMALMLALALSACGAWRNATGAYAQKKKACGEP